jgi:hydrogenase expression/formation protein HypD
MIKIRLIIGFVMKHLSEYRRQEDAEKLARAIYRITTRPWTMMEVCGGQTHAIVKYGIDELLPKNITLVHGPGCPVCVTPLELIDKAINIASRTEVIFCSYGDMLRVPGSSSDLLSVKAQGGDVRIVYSPMDALTIAKNHPAKEVVFFAVGFETTAPANAASVFHAKKQSINNYSILVSHVLVPPAIDLILGSPQNRVEGFLAAGHVCTVMGYHEYEPLSERYRIPIVVTGFEPVDILQGIYMLVRQLEEGRASVENQYSRLVTREGNVPAQKMLKEVFEIIQRTWRGIGEIPLSGLGLNENYNKYDAEKRFKIADIKVRESQECISGLVLQGIKKPNECTAFGRACSPEHPLGATMVSSEGACAAYYRYRVISESM